MIGQVRLRYGTVTMEDDGSFTSDEVPEIAQAMAGHWVLFRRHFHRAQEGLCGRFLRRQAELLGAELTLADDKPQDTAPATQPRASRAAKNEDPIKSVR